MSTPRDTFKTPITAVIISIPIAIVIGILLFTLGNFIDPTVNAVNELEHELLYTYSMSYVGKHDGITIDAVRLYPNQLLKGESAIFEILLENHDNSKSGIVLEVVPYNTDKVDVIPARFGYGVSNGEPTGSNAFDPYESKKFTFEIHANDVVGTYFITNLEINVYNENGDIIDEQKVPIVITTGFDRSYQELLDGWMQRR